MARITSNQFKTILSQIRDSFLEKMKEKGFWLNGKRRHDPFPWDINNGLCEDFALEVLKHVPKAEMVDIVDFEGTKNEEKNCDLLLEFSHFWILWNGKHYDAECIDGVKIHRELPFFKYNPRPDLPKSIRKLAKEYHKDGITPLGINNGFCADFATVIWERFGRCSIQILNNEELTGEEYLHTFMKHGALFYDAEAPNGVSDWQKLPFFKRDRRESARKFKIQALQSS